MDVKLDAVLTQRVPKDGIMHVLVVVSEHAHAAKSYYHAESVYKAAALPWKYVAEQSDFEMSVSDELCSPLV